MAAYYLDAGLAISRDGTAGNNLDVDQLNMIDQHGDSDGDAGARIKSSRGPPPAVPQAIPRRVPPYYRSEPSENSWEESDGDVDSSDSSSVQIHFRERPNLSRIQLRTHRHTDETEIRGETSSRRRSEYSQISPRGSPVTDADDGDNNGTDSLPSQSVMRPVNNSSSRNPTPRAETSSCLRNTQLVHSRQHEAASDDDVRALRDELERLRRENEEMRQTQEQQQVPRAAAQPAATYKTFYEILVRDSPNGGRFYLDEPQWEPGEYAPVLRSDRPIRGLKEYLEQHPDIAFAIVKTYNPRPPMDASKIERQDGAYRTPEPTSQYLTLITPDMREAVELFVDEVPEFYDLFPNFDVGRRIEAPYLFMFHSAPYFPEIRPDLDSVSAYLVGQLVACIEKSHGFEHETAKARAKEGLISNDMFAYFIRPGDVLVQRKGPRTQAFVALDWPRETEDSREKRKDDFAYDSMNSKTGATSKGYDTLRQEKIQIWYGWEVPVWSWRFDGNFQQHRRIIEVGLTASYSGEILPIDELDIIPLHHAPVGVRKKLEKRGKTFWSLRHNGYICYRHSEDGELGNVDNRYMVDVSTYKKLHPKSAISLRNLRSDIPRQGMANNSPPGGVALLVFPYMLPGFHLLRKMWVDLYVDHMTPVEWNKQAFADLVVDDETKELVQALVMKQLAASQSTDFIAGKGNGLIVLLHGGPGTGKTFTAEGVAEFAEKPLLRVTCGDVGIVANEVERKLQSSFYLGKLWDCVILLDEADVFLEERDMKDLNRNALVSVFLRELEYHDGILILTSNRVGTFDEAFKSRIQLSLHYENLGLSQRRKIWRNFINRVKSLDPTIDYDDIIDHLEDLSRIEMNGREIRNAITTARQLAQFKGNPLSYAQLSHVLRVSRKFGKYLVDLRNGLTADEEKRESGLRLTYNAGKPQHRESPF